MISLLWSENIPPNTSVSGNSKVSKNRQETQTAINGIIKNKFRNFEGMSYLEKIVAVDAFIQQNMQFMNDSEYNIFGEIYPPFKNLEWDTHNPLEVLKNGGGVCEGISDTLTLLLNNPVANVDCRRVSAGNHTWNHIW